MKIVIIAALAAAAWSAPVAAEGDRSQTVSHADLDLASDAGRSELNRRIGLAVRNACGSASDANLKGKNEVRRCRALTYKHISAQTEVAVAAARRPSSTLFASDR